MALTLSQTKSGVHGDLAYWIGTATFDSSYPKDGESLTAANLGFSDILDLRATLRNAGNNGSCYWDDTNSKLKLYAQIVGPTLAIDGETAVVGLVDDDDNAATEGVQVYAVVDSDPGIVGAARGHFEFVSPTNVDGRGEWSVLKFQYVIKDQDLAATNGVAVRAIAADAGLEATFGAALGAGGPLYVPYSGGGIGAATGGANTAFEGVFARVAESTTASTPGVFFDEDEAEETIRLQAVVVDNADETYPLFTVLSNGEVPGLTNCAAAVVDIVAMGIR